MKLATEPVYTTKIPPGGTRGQALIKASDKDYYVRWGASSGTPGSCECEEMSVLDIINIIGNK